MESVIPDGDKGAVHWKGVVQDIRNRKRMEEALQASEAELRTLFAALPDITIVFDRQGRYLKVMAPRTLADFIKLEDHLHKTVTEVLPTEQAQLHLDCIQWVIEHQQTLTDVEYNRVIGNQEKWFSAIVSPLAEDRVIWVARDISDRKRAEEAVRLEQAKSEQLLLNILPKPIADRLKDDQSAIADSFPEVTILFADIVDFTKLSANISPRALVNFLNRIFSIFDELTDRYGLEKIKTIGDAYMAVGGLPHPRPDHAEAVADMALAMQQELANFSIDNGQQILMRVGIHTGPVVAGVIGTRKFIYDLWGDAVNVASRMETHGQPGSIQVTEETYQRLRHAYNLEYRGVIPVKGKGEMATYWLTGKK